jgi:hypothetical protein
VNNFDPQYIVMTPRLSLISKSGRLDLNNDNLVLTPVHLDDDEGDVFSV